MFLPQRVHIERSIDIQRPAATVYTVLNSYRSFAAWSPWAERDPDAVYEISGPAAGPGARLAWRGDPRLVGTGWQEITESQPHSLVRMYLDFDQQGVAESYFRIEPTESGTHLSWGFDTDLLEGQSWFGGVLARYFGLFFDKWIGTDYELGLARLKAYLESLPPADFSDLEVEIVEAEAVDILYVASDAAPDSPDITAGLAAAYQEITAYMAEQGMEVAAQPMAITRIGEDGRYEIEAAIPVRRPDAPPTAQPDETAAGTPVEGPVETATPEPPAAASLVEPAPASRVRLGHSPAGRAVRVVHRGPYERMGPTYEKLAAWIAAHALEEGRVSWEQYISDPGETPEEELITHIYFRIGDGG
jgi:effector-binding domain-containing protein